MRADLVRRLGGIAVWLTFLIVFLGFVDLTPPRLALLVGMTLLFLMGLVDDIYNLSPITKLVWQIGAVAIAVGLGLHIGQVTNPFGGVIVLSPIWDYLLSGFWLLIVVNAVNMLDGLDGLSAGATSIFSIIIFFLSLFMIVNQPTTAMMAVILLGTMLGYLGWNWYPAKIFYGDAGSNMVGFIMGALAIVSGGKIATAALVLGFPIMDLLWAALRRIKQGRSPFAADREHLHHLLFDLGLGQRTVVALIYLLTLGFGLAALASGTWLKLIILAVVVLVLAGIIRLVLHFKQVTP